MAEIVGVLDRKEVLRQIADILATPDLREVHITFSADKYSVPSLTYTVTRDVLPKPTDGYAYDGE